MKPATVRVLDFGNRCICTMSRDRSERLTHWGIWKMKRLALALSAVAAFAAPALAADMAPRYTKAPPPPVAAVVHWTGCYVGGGGGYGMWNEENTGEDECV